MKGNKLTFGILTLLLAFLSAGHLKAQDPNFSQYFNNPVYYNPALIGADIGTKVRFQYRNQWTQLPGEFKTINFNMDVAERKMPGSGGLGLMFNRKQEGQGFLETSNIGLGMSVRVPLQQNIVTQLGFMGSFVSRTLNWDNLVFSDELDPRYGHINNSNFTPPDGGGQGQVTYPDLTIGNIVRFFPESLSGSKMIGTLGVALHHTLKPDDSYIGIPTEIPQKWVVHGNMLWVKQGSSSTFSDNPFSGLTKYDFGFLLESWQQRSNFALGMNVMQSNLYFGAWYKGESYGDFRSDAMVFMLGVNYGIADNARMKIMYSYDWALNELVSISGPTHEITLIMQLDDLMMFGFGDSFGGRPGARSGGIVKKPLECSPF